MNEGARGPVRTKLHEAWARLRGGALTPWRAAFSVGIGLAVGVTPLYGLHLPIVLAICVPLRLDAPIAYLAANISVPFIAPFLWLAEVEIGAWLRTGRGLHLDVGTLKALGPRAFASEIVVGTLVFAPLMAMLGGTIAFVLTPSTKKREALDLAIDRVAARYGRERKATRYYVRGKLASDPVARRVAELGKGGALGEVADVGCGRGQLGVLLLETSAATKVTGFDWDAAKVEEGARAGEGLPLALEEGDLRTHAVPPCDTALLIDVLHYLTDQDQDAVLARAACAARKCVIVRELDPDRRWRSAVTRLQERITTSLGYNRGARVAPRKIDALTRTLEANGFDTRVEPCWGKTPYANVLITGTRRAGASK